MRAYLAAILLAACAGAQAVPRLFIVQIRVHQANQELEDLNLDAYLASAFEETGKVEVVVWSLTDPIFKQIVNSGEIPNGAEFPSEAALRDIARRVKADYTLVVRAVKSGDAAQPTATLHMGAMGRKIWSYGKWDNQKYSPEILAEDEVDARKIREINNRVLAGQTQLFATKINGIPDWDSVSLTIARTWESMLDQTTFKNLPRRPKPSLPSGNTIKNTTGPAVPDSSGKTAIELADQYLKQGRGDLAILVLRDAVDENPFDPARRELLASTLLSLGYPLAAAAEAERAAQVSKSPVKMWLLAARAWLLSGKPTEAKNALNESLARGADGPVAHALLGDYYVTSSDYSDAIHWYTKSLAESPTPQAIIGRAVAYAMLGSTENCKADLHLLREADANRLEQAYITAVTLADERAAQISKNLRDLAPMIRLYRSDQAVFSRSMIAARQADALGVLIASIPVPEKFANSHNSRLLAHKLLAQSAQETLEFAKTGDEGTADEAAISLGEALDLFPPIRIAFLSERGIK